MVAYCNITITNLHLSGGLEVRRRNPTLVRPFYRLRAAGALLLLLCLGTAAWGQAPNTNCAAAALLTLDPNDDCVDVTYTFDGTEDLTPGIVFCGSTASNPTIFYETEVPASGQLTITTLSEGWVRLSLFEDCGAWANPCYTIYSGQSLELSLPPGERIIVGAELTDGDATGQTLDLCFREGPGCVPISEVSIGERGDDSFEVFTPYNARFG